MIYAVFPLIGLLIGIYMGEYAAERRQAVALKETTQRADRAEALAAGCLKVLGGRK